MSMKKMTTNERRYLLQSVAANQQIAELLEGLQVPQEPRPYYAQMLTTVLKMHEDGADLGNLKLANTALKELRYAFKVFEPYRDVPKVTVFGSARTGPDDPISVQARGFARSIAAHGWMVMTGAGNGVMGAAQEGAGIGPGFGLHIRLPWETEANPWIAEDPKLISFKYFFTRKLFLVKEADAACLLPGGFGTLDEAFEVLTLVQTGKTAIIPVVLLDAPGDDYWRVWEGFIRRQMLARQLIAADDLHLLRITDDVEEAVAAICGFYRNFHSSRFVGDALLLRIQRPLPPELLSALQDEYADILKGDVQQHKGPLPAEGEEWPDLWRLVLPFSRSQYGRLRRLIDSINRV